MSKRMLIYYAKCSRGKIESYSNFFLKEIKDSFDSVMIVALDAPLSVELENRNEIKWCTISGEEKHCIDAYYWGMQSEGLENLRQYDEIVCVSDEIMGPLYDMGQVFDYMTGINCDFWGIIKQHSTPLNYLDYSGQHLQEEYILPEFLVFRNSILSCEEFKGILEAVGGTQPFQQSIIDAKALYLTSQLREKGFLAETYVNTEDIKNIYYNPLLFAPKKLIQYRNCPVFLKESFQGDYDTIISNTAGEPAVLLYDYLAENTEYDVDMIWESILKTGHQQDINHNLHLNYVLSAQQYDKEKLDRILQEKKVALVMHLYFPDLLDESLHYAQSMPDKSDIYITTNTTEKKLAIEEKYSVLSCNKLEVRLVENRGRDVSSLLTGVKDVVMNYDYICFVHDKKSAQVIPGSIGRDFAYQCLENTLGTKAYVANIISSFYDNKRLGMLSPLYPIHGSYYPVNGYYDWGDNYENTKQLAQKLGLTVPISEDKSPVAPLGTMFWFRSEALKILYDCDWEYEDFPPEPNGIDGTLLHAVERIYSYVAQQQGLYPAMVGNELFANISLTNLTDFIQGINREVKKHRGFNSYQQILYVISQSMEEVNRLRYENECRQKRIEELIPQTSFKWQINDRIRKFLHLRKK